MAIIYLDANATTRPTQRVIEAITTSLCHAWANPSSVHRLGQVARHEIEKARASLAQLLGLEPIEAKQIVFTSSGTEALVTAIQGLLRSHADSHRGRGEKPRIVTTAVEHAAIRDLCEHLERTGDATIVRAPIDGNGVVKLDGFDALVDGAALCAIQWANNETGVVQPIDAIGAKCRARGIPFVCDATQWVGKEPMPAMDAGDRPYDVLICSAHKFHGPKGVGVMWVRPGIRWRPLLHGSQELGKRGGTENVPGIVGAGEAAREATEWLADPARRDDGRTLRDRFEQGVLAAIPEARVNSQSRGVDGRVPARLWNTTNIGFPTLEAEALLLLLSEQGVCASAGAACSSGSLEPSPVLLAMGVPERFAHGSIRFSLSRETTASEIDDTIAIVARSVHRLQASSSALAR